MMRLKLLNKNIHRQTEIGEDYHNICRLCLTRTSLKLHLYLEEGQRRDIQGKILNCLSLIITEDDCLPKFICHSCIGKLENFQEFRDMCHESENLLIEYVSAAQSKQHIKSNLEHSSTSWPLAEFKRGIQESVLSESPIPQSTAASMFIKTENEDSLFVSPEETGQNSVWLQDRTVTKHEGTCGLQSNVLNHSKLEQHFSAELNYVNRSQDNGSTIVSSEVVSGSEFVSDFRQNISESDKSKLDDSGHFHDGDVSIKEEEDDDDDLVILSEDLAESSVAHAKSSTNEEQCQGAPSQQRLPFRGSNFLISSQSSFKKVSAEIPRIDGYTEQNKLVSEHVPKLSSRKKYVCNECDKVFPGCWNLRRHQRLHSGEKPYTCPTCKKTFSDKSNFNRHVWTHGRNPYFCNNCQQVFSTSDGLAIHQQICVQELDVRNRAEVQKAFDLQN